MTLPLRDGDETCPTCGCPVRVVGSDEGTMHYERVPAVDVRRVEYFLRCIDWQSDTAADAIANEFPAWLEER